MSLKGGRKNFFKILFVISEKSSQLVSEGKNLTNLENRILGDAARLLRRAGMSEQANEMADRVHKSSNYYEALGIISEYVETELSDHREQPRTPRKETLKKEDTCR